jgi:hypothetical protein
MPLYLNFFRCPYLFYLSYLLTRGSSSIKLILMVKPGFEIFFKGKDTWGVILKSPRRFKAMNDLLSRFYEGERLGKGEEALFWVSESDIQAVKRILGLKAWPTPSSFDLAND